MSRATNSVCVIPALPRIRRKAEKIVEARYERRPHRSGEKREARRLEEGFRMMQGEGVYADEAQ